MVTGPSMCLLLAAVAMAYFAKFITSKEELNEYLDTELPEGADPRSLLEARRSMLTIQLRVCRRARVPG